MSVLGLSSLSVPRQLPEVVTPTHYNLSLRLGSDGRAMDGHVDIKLHVLEETDRISLHSEKLEVYQARLTYDSIIDPVYFNASDTVYQVDTNEVTLMFNRSLVMGKNFTLSMEFRSDISELRRYGLFSSQVEKSDNRTRVISTSFQPWYARRAFPCWDEPGYKATFDILLDVPHNFTAVSNNEVDFIEELGDRKRFLFKTTPIMATHNLAFAMGDFEYIEDKAIGYHRTNPILCRLYTIRGYSKKALENLEALIKSINLFEEYLQVPYKLNKMDLLAVPNLLSEVEGNRGLIMMKHDNLIMSGPTNREEQIKINRMAIIHGVAQQWFGNLVTMRRWNDAWFSAALAMYFEVVAGKVLYPQYDLNNWIQLKYLSPSSSKKGSELLPIHNTVVNSTLTDGKGVAVLWMLNKLITESVFKTALQTYLKSNESSNISINDFLSAIPNLPEFHVKNFGKTWIESNNYPYLTISESPINNLMKLTITQLPFFSENSQLIWNIPISIILDNTKEDIIELNLKNQTITVTIPKKVRYKINSNSLGFVKSLYPTTALQRISDVRSHFYDLHELDEIIESTSFLIKNRRVSQTLMLDLLLGLKSNKNMKLISIFQLHTQDYLTHWLQLKKFQTFYNTILSSWYDHFDSKSIWHTTTLNHAQKIDVILYLALKGDKDLLNSANEAFNHLIHHPQTTISNNMITNLFRAVLTQENPYYLSTLLSLLDSNSKFKPNIIASLSYSHLNHLPLLQPWLKTQSPDTLLQFLTDCRSGQAYSQIIWQSLQSRWSTLSLSPHRAQLPQLISIILTNLILTDSTEPILDFIKNMPSRKWRAVMERFKEERRVYEEELPNMEKRLDQINPPKA